MIASSKTLQTTRPNVESEVWDQSFTLAILGPYISESKESLLRLPYIYTQIIQLASIRWASSWIDVPDFTSVLTVTGGQVAA